MKFAVASIAAALVLATTTTNAFAPQSSFVAKKSMSSSKSSNPFTKVAHQPSSGRLGGTAAPLTPLQMAYTVGIVGATGAVGKEIVQVLENRQNEIPISKLRIFASERSAGKTIKTSSFGDVQAELFDVDKARECDVVFLAVGGDFSLKYAEAIAEGDDGAVCIDNSSAFRYYPNIPLVVPEINGEETKKSKLIANPNCTTAIALMAIWPLYKLFGMKRVIVSTYQAASGAGQPGMDELQDGTRDILNGKEAKNAIFAHPLPFNVIPHIDKFLENGYTKEEMKVTWETRKICGLADDFPLSCTAVRIPTIRAHSESIVVETEKPVDLAAARKALEEAPGVQLVDDPENNKYPMPIHATGLYDVQVGRLRKNLVFGDYGLEFFVCGDQLLRGAALNAVLVAEEMVNNGSLKPKAVA